MTCQGIDIPLPFKYNPCMSTTDTEATKKLPKPLKTAGYKIDQGLAVALIQG
ncbi:hypothetical protein LCGC14_3124250, partial [marine sediment metagenome]